VSRRSAAPWVLGILAALVLAAALLSVSLGAIRIPPERVLAALTGEGSDPARARDALVILSIRLPRTLLGLLVGAGLAVSGALMQGLFRNPLADPALVGVSSGAGLAAAVIIVLGDRILARLGVPGPLPYAALPAGAFLGGLCATLILYALATRSGRTAVATMLLAGIALGALSGALTGLLTFVSDDRQLRDLAFWSLGSLGGATWSKVAASAPLILPVLAAVPLLGRGLNALVLGEAEAFHLGVPVERLKRACIVLVAVAVGASVAAAGVIGFVGLAAPHLVRRLWRDDPASMLAPSAVAGAGLLTLADLASRLIPTEQPLKLGVVTALVGAPLFALIAWRAARSWRG